MIQIQTIGTDDKAIRTQITLTKNIKSLVADIASEKGESLSEYLRKAALIRILLDRQEKEDLEKIAKSLIGSVKLSNHPEWSTPSKVYKWVRSLREEK